MGPRIGYAPILKYFRSHFCEERSRKQITVNEEIELPHEAHVVLVLNIVRDSEIYTL